MQWLNEPCPILPWLWHLVWYFIALIIKVISGILMAQHVSFFCIFSSFLISMLACCQWPSFSLPAERIQRCSLNTFVTSSTFTKVCIMFFLIRWENRFHNLAIKQYTPFCCPRWNGYVILCGKHLFSSLTVFLHRNPQFSNTNAQFSFLFIHFYAAYLIYS